MSRCLDVLFHSVKSVTLHQWGSAVSVRSPNLLFVWLLLKDIKANVIINSLTALFRQKKQFVTAAKNETQLVKYILQGTFQKIFIETHYEISSSNECGVKDVFLTALCKPSSPNSLSQFREAGLDSCKRHCSVTGFCRRPAWLVRLSPENIISWSLIFATVKEPLERNSGFSLAGSNAINLYIKGSLCFNSRWYLISLLFLALVQNFTFSWVKSFKWVDEHSARKVFVFSLLSEHCGSIKIPRCNKITILYLQHL